VLETAELDGEGMAYDFVAVKRALDELAARLDHRDVNTVPPFDALSRPRSGSPPGFFAGLAERLPGAPLTALTVWEGPDCSATYRP